MNRKINYKIDGDIPKWMVGVVEKEYMRCYRIWAERSDRYFREFNACYFRTFDVTDTETLGRWHYLQWMAEKITWWISESIHSPLLTFTVNPYTLEMEGHYRFGRKPTTIRFYTTEAGAL